MGHYECNACGQRYDNCVCADFKKKPSTRRKNEPSFLERCKGILCLNHKRYRAARQPRAACEECWRAWITAEDKRLAERDEIEKILAGPTTLPSCQPARLPYPRQREPEPEVEYCNESIPGHHLEECVRRKGHDGYCSSSLMELGK